MLHSREKQGLSLSAAFARNQKLSFPVDGELKVTNVSVAASAKINGDIVHENISIESHARVEGQLVRRDTQQTNLNLISDETDQPASASSTI